MEQRRIMLEVELERAFETLNELEPVSPEYKEQYKTFKDILSHIEFIETRRDSKNNDRLQMDDKKKDRILSAVKIGLDGVKVIGTFALFIWGTKVATLVEEEHSYTTTLGRSVVGTIFKSIKL